MVYRRIVFLLSLFAIPYALHGQATPTASRSLAIQLGGEVTGGAPDYTPKKIGGFSIFGDIDYGAHFGVEVAYHDLNIHTPWDLGESSTVFDLRYKLNKRKFHPFGKAGFVLASQNFQEGYYASSYSTKHKGAEAGTGVDYYLTEKIHLRLLDYEYQRWSFQPHGLTPWMISVGAAYSF